MPIRLKNTSSSRHTVRSPQSPSTGGGDPQTHVGILLLFPTADTILFIAGGSSSISLPYSYDQDRRYAYTGPSKVPNI
ncbi:hypothetical protein GOBAR_AA27896 [Gossypium barbadense]|uniref:Uncharacterized protein n=1 Tax=Gossypium barbadense TaxID=3634 RepID=A0A2P5WNX3_GOSBA|nr:hypothetical protein GOBAR_AA27896 [Gossypium barbadense]